MLARVLVVDDDPAIRRLLRLLLHHNGARVVAEASSGRGALDALRDCAVPPHLAIVDFHMPDMDGLDCVQQARAFRPDQQMVLYTADAGHPMIRRRAAAADVEVVAKQDIAGLLATVSASVYPSVADVRAHRPPVSPGGAVDRRTE